MRGNSGVQPRHVKFCSSMGHVKFFRCIFGTFSTNNAPEKLYMPTVFWWFLCGDVKIFVPGHVKFFLVGAKPPPEKLYMPFGLAKGAGEPGGRKIIAGQKRGGRGSGQDAGKM